MDITDKQVDEAAEIIERSASEALFSGSSLRDASVYAAHEVRQLWGIGFRSEDPSLSEAATR
jgi:hypothetical protein